MSDRVWTLRHSIVRVALVTGAVLLIPLLGNLYVDGWNWHWYSFVAAGILLFGAGLTFEWVANKKKGNKEYRFAVGLAVAAALVLTWVNLAVGIVGEFDDHPVNLLYFAVPAVGVGGAAIARLEPRGMARALFATAFAQALVAVIPLITGWGVTAPIQPRDILIVTVLFVVLWLASARLFQKAAGGSPA